MFSFDIPGPYTIGRAQRVVNCLPGHLKRSDLYAVLKGLLAFACQ